MIRFLSALLIALAARSAFGDVGTFSASPGGAFITSEANARGIYLGGIKTVSAVLPLRGFGNIVNADGTCSYNPTNDWVYTKKVETISWSTNLGSIFRGNDVPTQQAMVIAEQAASGRPLVDGSGSCAATLFDGYNYLPLIGVINGIPCAPPYGSSDLCLYDRSSETNFPANAGGSFSTNTVKTNLFFPYYATSGPSNLVVAAATNGFLDTTSTSWINTGSSFHTNFYANVEEGVGDMTGFWNSTNYVTGSTSVYQYTNQETGRLDYFTYPTFHACVSGFDGNSLFGTFTASYTRTVEYSEPRHISDLAAPAKTILDGLMVPYKGLRYFYFDQTNTPVYLTWNQVKGVSGLYYYYIYRSRTSGTGPWTLLAAVLETYYNDSSPIGVTNWYYVQYYTYRSNTNSILTTAPSYPIFDPSPVRNFTPVTNASPTVYLDVWKTLEFTNILGATNAPVGFAAFPLAGTNFVLSCKGSFSKYPVLLSAYAEPFGSNQPPISTSGISDNFNVGNFVWSRSYGYLAGNSTNHVPPGTNYEQKVYFVSATNTTPADVTASVQPLVFSCGRLGTWPWQTTRRMQFNETNQFAAGYLYYR